MKADKILDALMVPVIVLIWVAALFVALILAVAYKATHDAKRRFQR